MVDMRTINNVENELESILVQLASEALQQAKAYAGADSYDFLDEAQAAGVTPDAFLAHKVQHVMSRGEVFCELAHLNSDMSDRTRLALIDIERELSAIRSRPYAHVYCIYHAYDVGDQQVYVCRESGNIDAKEAALYLQFQAEAFYGESAMLSNLGIAALLIEYYGFQHWHATAPCTSIDMYSEREHACYPEYYGALMENKDLYREGLKDSMKCHLRS